MPFGGTNMWLDNLKELKKEKNMSTKQLAALSSLPEKTITRILSGATANPYIDTLDRLATALDSNIGEILAGTRTVIGDTSLATLQETIDSLTVEKDTVVAERDLMNAENAILKDKITTLTAEIDLLKMQLMHKEELLALHSYYIALQKK
jgi:transcriptional regulator with XRE-family HTH domain